eukprot:TRINITY_DN786_c1_g1_i6.p1 TRINITY_DN786_c1_g1~~TRINITY_DN786_c1_g1_i6.p1  ORF type:complete len:893 (+),score=231.12 TRINITY_DN786_c1_g1_i6:1216-3894(+)
MADQQKQQQQQQQSQYVAAAGVVTPAVQVNEQPSYTAQNPALLIPQQQQGTSLQPPVQDPTTFSEQSPSYSLFSTIWTPQPNEQQNQNPAMIDATAAAADNNIGVNPVQKQLSGVSSAQVYSILSEQTENITTNSPQQSGLNGSQVAAMNAASPLQQEQVGMAGSSGSVWEAAAHQQFVHKNQQGLPHESSGIEPSPLHTGKEEPSYSGPSAALLQYNQQVYGRLQEGQNPQAVNQVLQQQEKVMSFLQSQPPQAMQFEQHNPGTPHPPPQQFDVDEVGIQFNSLMIEFLKEQQHMEHQAPAGAQQPQIIGDPRVDPQSVVTQQQQKQAALILQLLQQHHLNPASLALTPAQQQQLLQQLQLYQYNQQQQQQQQQSAEHVAQQQQQHQQQQQQQQFPPYTAVAQQYQNLLGKLVQLHQSGQLAHLQPAALASLLMGQQSQQQVGVHAVQEQYAGSTAGGSGIIYDQYQQTGQQPAAQVQQPTAEVTEDQARFQQNRTRSQQQLVVETEAVPVAQYDKVKRENGRLQGEVERLHKEVQRQKALREDDRQEFLAAKERLKKGWAQDRDDFARVKEQLKKKNADHHVQNGRLAQSFKEAEQTIRSLREFCASNGYQLPPELESATNARGRPKPGEDVQTPTAQQAGQAQPATAAQQQQQQDTEKFDDVISIFSRDESSVQVDMDAEDHIGEVGDESETHHAKHGSTTDAMPRTPQSEPAEQDDSTDMVTRQAVQAAATAAAALNQLALTLAQQMPSDQPVVSDISNIQNLTNVLTSIAQSVPGDQSANGNPATNPPPETSTAPSTPLSNAGQLDAMDQIVGTGQVQGQGVEPVENAQNVQKVETNIDNMGSKMDAVKEEGEREGDDEILQSQQQQLQSKLEQIEGEENTIKDCNQ